MNLFGKKKAAPPPNPAEAIMKLRGTMETLTKREAYIQKKIELMVAEAKAKMARKDKNGALFALKKKKMYEVRTSYHQPCVCDMCLWDVTGTYVCMDGRIDAVGSTTTPRPTPPCTLYTPGRRRSPRSRAP